MTSNTVLNTATIPITVPEGGTGISTGTTAYATLCAGTAATGAFQPTASAGTSGQILFSNGSSALPSFMGQSFTQIANLTATSSATINFTGMTGFTNYLLLGNNITPATNNAMLSCRFSNNGGSSYTAGSTDYRFNFWSAFGSSNAINGNNTGSLILLNSGTSNTANVASTLLAWIFKPAGSEYTTVVGGSFFIDSSGNDGICWVGGQCTAITGNNAVQLLMTPSGNITTGNFQLYGMP
jgi:hypothetical protein